MRELHEPESSPAPSPAEGDGVTRPEWAGKADNVMLPKLGAVPATMVDDAGVVLLRELVESIQIVNGIACWNHMTMFALRDYLCARAASQAQPKGTPFQWPDAETCRNKGAVRCVMSECRDAERCLAVRPAQAPAPAPDDARAEALRVLEVLRQRYNPENGPYRDDGFAILSRHIAAISSPAVPHGKEQHQPAEWLIELASRIDPDELWRRPVLEALDMPPEQQARLEAGVNLRRYADLLGEGHWRIFPPRRGVCFRSITLAGAAAMAQRDEERRAESQPPVQNKEQP